MKTYKVFYSWQSDLPEPTNRAAIRQALRAASSLVENDIEGIKIDVDEATRDTPGSPNIPKTIFDKISVSDIFVCDLTTINSLAAEISNHRPVPNPNVLIELGYAIAHLGWGRIIMLFNKIYGDFSDLPFDIDRYRATAFEIKDKDDKKGKNQFVQTMKNAVQAIIEKKPLKPSEEQNETPEQKKRSIDVCNLRLVLNTIHIPTFDIFLTEMPLLMRRKILYFKSQFFSVFQSSEFYIYDEKLRELLNEFKGDWEKSLSFGRSYGVNEFSNDYCFDLPMDTFPHKQAEEDYNKLEEILADLEVSFKDLLAFIRNNYLEIDLTETSKNALESYRMVYPENEL